MDSGVRFLVLKFAVNKGKKCLGLNKNYRIKIVEAQAKFNVDILYALRVRVHGTRHQEDAVWSCYGRIHCAHPERPVQVMYWLRTLSPDHDSEQSNLSRPLQSASAIQ